MTRPTSSSHQGPQVGLARYEGLVPILENAVQGIGGCISQRLIETKRWSNATFAPRAAANTDHFIDLASIYEREEMFNAWYDEVLVEREAPTDL